MPIRVNDRRLAAFSLLSSTLGTFRGAERRQSYAAFTTGAEVASIPFRCAQRLASVRFATFNFR